MADRILVWHIPIPGSPTPVFYAEHDYEPAFLRVYAENAPGAGDLLVDVLDDGASIMNANNYTSTAIKNEDAYIEFGTPSGTFTVNETITGGTSGATGKVRANAFGRVTLYDVSATVFTAGETITGGSSSATGVVGTYVRAIHSVSNKTVAGQSHAALGKGRNSDDAAQDFKPGVDIRQGSWISLSVLDFAGASKVTVQLELNEL